MEHFPYTEEEKSAALLFHGKNMGFQIPRMRKMWKITEPHSKMTKRKSSHFGDALLASWNPNGKMHF